MQNTYNYSPPCFGATLLYGRNIIVLHHAWQEEMPFTFLKTKQPACYLIAPFENKANLKYVLCPPISILLHILLFYNLGIAESHGNGETGPPKMAP